MKASSSSVLRSSELVLGVHVQAEVLSNFTAKQEQKRRQAPRSLFRSPDIPQATLDAAAAEDLKAIFDAYLRWIARWAGSAEVEVASGKDYGVWERGLRRGNDEGERCVILVLR